MMSREYAIVDLNERRMPDVIRICQEELPYNLKFINQIQKSTNSGLAIRSHWGYSPHSSGFTFLDYENE